MTEASELLALLHRWMPQQRWYPVKGKGVSLSEAGRMDLPSPDETVQIIGHLIGIDSGDAFDVVQVPLTYRTAVLPDATSLGSVGDRQVYDGPSDPAFVDALLASLQLADGQAAPATGCASTVLSGEQSNTSIIVDPASDRPLIVKVFRLVHSGRNPDVEVIGALTNAGCTAAPALVGWVDGSWSDRSGSSVTGDLAVATEFLSGSQDAWRVALEAAATGADFTEQARSLGATTAQVHIQLREIFGTSAASPDEAGELIAGMQRRVDWAIADADALAPHRESLAAHRDSLTSLQDSGLPNLQRIHGDYHLGQVLHSPTRGWVLLDFEGEPLRPLSERTLPDLALRDVVGMLRSFDYAVGHVAVTTPGSATQATEWAAGSRAAFLSGYAAVAREDPTVAHSELFTALWLDKALYEVVYETRNRPAWIGIPLAAVEQGLRR